MTNAETLSTTVPQVLPASWRWEHLSSVTEIVTQGADPKTSPAALHIAPDNIESSTGRLLPCRTVEEDQVVSNNYRFEKGDVLYTKLRPYLNKVVVAPSEGLCSSDILPIRSWIDASFLRYWMLSPGFLAQAIPRQTGVTLPRISRGALTELKVPIAPLPEQRRIVEAIESNFARLDVAVAALERVRSEMKRYRATVLKTAFSGRLVPTERGLALAEGRPYEDGASLVHRLGGQVYEEEGAQLPDGWALTTVGSIFDVVIGATPSRRVESYWGGNIPWVSSGEVSWCTIHSTRESITREGLENSSTKVLPPGTVLLGMIGQGKTRGQAAILEIEACSNQNAAAILVGKRGLPPRFIYYFFQHRYERTRQEGSGNEQQALNKSIVRSIPLALPPAAEQERIVAEIDRRFSTCDEGSAEVNSNLVRCTVLRQSILKTAFEGRIVPQDPTDEPASVLLERIKREHPQAVPSRSRSQGTQRPLSIEAES